jgi:hypothetical protein
MAMRIIKEIYRKLAHWDKYRHIAGTERDKDKIERVILTTAGEQFLNPGELIYDDTEILSIRPAKKEDYQVNTENINKFKFSKQQKIKIYLRKKSKIIAELKEFYLKIN